MSSAMRSEAEVDSIFKIELDVTALAHVTCCATEYKLMVSLLLLSENRNNELRTGPM